MYKTKLVLEETVRVFFCCLCKILSRIESQNENERKWKVLQEYQKKIKLTNKRKCKKNKVNKISSGEIEKIPYFFYK